MYDPLSDNTRVVNVPGTDTLLQIMLKKERTFILPLSKSKLRGDPESWRNSIITGSITGLSFLIWTTFLNPALFPFILIMTPVFMMAITVGAKALSNFMTTDVLEEEASDEDIRDFDSGKNLPEISVDKNLLNSSEQEIIETYRKEALSVKTQEKMIPEFVDDTTFTELFYKEENTELTDKKASSEIYKELLNADVDHNEPDLFEMPATQSQQERKL